MQLGSSRQVGVIAQIATVTVDGASDTRACHDAIAARSATAGFRQDGMRGHGSRTRPGGQGTQREPAGIEASWPGALAELEWVSPPQQGGNKNELREPLDQRLMLRNFDRQVAEVQIRAAVMNRLTALGIQITVDMG